MKTIRGSIGLAAIFALFFASGCVKGPDIAVTDVATGKIIHPKYDATRRQIIVSVDDSNHVFRNMVRDNDHLIIRTFKQECLETKQASIPFFSEGYCSRWGRALSQDGNRIVYFRDNTKDLCLYDMTSCQESQIWPKIARFEMYVPKVEWLSDSTLLIIRQEDQEVAESKNEIIFFNLVSGVKKTLVNPIYLSNFDYALSPDRHLLAYWEGRSKNSIYGNIKVLNLKKGLVVATIGSGKDELIGHPSWSRDGKTLAYVEGARIMLFCLETNSSRIVRTLDEDIISYDLLMGQNVIIHHGAKNLGKGNYKKMPILILDARTGNCLKQIDLEVNGQMFFLETDREIVAEIGY